MSKKATDILKIVSMIVFYIVLLLLVFCTGFSIYLGGQKKAVDNFFTSIQRQNKEMFSENVNDIQISEHFYNDLYSEWHTEFGDDFKVRCDFVSRKLPDKYIVNIYVFNDKDYCVLNNKEIGLVRHNGNWLVDSIPDMSE